MRIEGKDIADEYVDRAMTEEDLLKSPISIPRIREPRDMVYNGPLTGPETPQETEDDQYQPRNRKRSRRTFSPFTLVMILFAVAISSILYIGNILAVGRLMAQINQLQLRHRQILNEQELLRAHMNRLSGLERIQQLAQSEIGLQKPKQLPVWIEIDPDRIEEVEAVIEQLNNRKK